MADTYVLDAGEAFRRLNFCENPSFETNTGGWTTGLTTLTRVTSDAYAGTASAQAVPTTTLLGSNARIGYDGVSVFGGIAYRFSCWVKNTGGATRDHRIRAVWNTSITDGAAVSVPAGGGWTYLEVSGTVPNLQTTVSVQIQYQLTNVSLSNVTLIDGVLIEFPADFYTTIPAETFYFDRTTTAGSTSGLSNVRTQAYAPDVSDYSACNYEKYTSDVVYLQTATVMVGSQNDVDAVSASNATFTAWYPDGFTTPVATLLPGNPVQLRRVGKTPPMWQGRIVDVQAVWGQPWTGTVGNGDTLTITAEGYGGEFGRAEDWNGNLSSNVQNALAVDVAGRGFYAEWLAPVGYDPELYSEVVTPLTSNAWEWMDYLASSFAGTLQDGNPTVQVVSGNYYDDTTASFSSTVNNASTRIIEAIEYDSLAESLYRYVTVENPDVLGLELGSGRGRDVTITTVGGTQAQADGLAAELIAKYGTPVYQVRSVDCRAEAQHTMNLDGLDATDPWNELIGKRTSVTFRGQTTPVRIIGIELTADPTTALYRYFFAAEQAVEYLILDSANYGILDTNRLGW